MESFARTWTEVREREEHARRMVGLTLRTVHYVDIDYRRETFAASFDGPRTISAAAEWAEPTWRWPGFDALDYGVELGCDGGRVFTVEWDTPGWYEGISLLERGGEIACADGTAVWDVTGRSRWTPFVGTPVLDVALEYEPWGDERRPGFWCPAITIRFAAGAARLLLGEADPDGTAVSPSATNVAVVFDVT